MKSNQMLKKIALLASGIAVFALTTATAADTAVNTGNETSIVNEDGPVNPDALCPNGQPRGTRSADCTFGNNGRQGHQGNFAKGRSGKGSQGNCSKGNGGNGRKGNVSKGQGGKGCQGQVAQGRGGRGNAQGRKGMGPGKGLGDRTGPGDGSCVQPATPTAET